MPGLQYNLDSVDVLTAYLPYRSRGTKKRTGRLTRSNQSHENPSFDLESRYHIANHLFGFVHYAVLITAMDCDQIS